MRLSATIPTHDIDPGEGLEGVIQMDPSSAQLKLWHAQMQHDNGVISGQELAVVERLAGSVAGKARTIYNPYTGEVRKAFLPDWYFKRRDHEAPMAGWSKSQSSVEERYFEDMRLLLEGDYEKGFERYEGRWKVRFNSAHARVYDKPQWTGQDLTGKTIYLWHEQGFGDTIMMHRYVPLVEALAKQVHFELPDPLVRLFEQNATDQHHVPGVITEWDYHCPMMSLPYAFKTRLDNIPPPSLRAEPSEAADVTLCWAGSRCQIPLAQMLELTDLSELTFGSAQYAISKDEEELLAERSIVNRSPKDFAELASQIAATSLVITVDTALAHVAGSLGKPTWLILGRLNDWRWGQDAETTPWYPTMRLFRQKAAGFSDVIGGVFDELRVYAGFFQRARGAVSPHS